jgi:uncharacterized protein YfaS (alpha-2-macroglobulin family)
MNHPRLTPAAAVLLLSIFSCAAPDTALRLSSPPPEGTLTENTGTLLFSFSRRVVPPDSVSLWTETPYVEFVPPVPGKFVWRDSSTLIFSADGPFQGDATFRGILNADLLARLAGAPSFEGSREFTFGTESFRLKGAELYYDRIGPTRSVGVRANLEFTYPADPQQVAAALRVAVDGTPVKIAGVPSAAPSRVIPVDIGTVQQLSSPKQVSLSFEGQLVSPETRTHITMERPLSVTLPALEDLRIYGHEFGTDGEIGWIRLSTSQEVDPAAARKSITVDPDRSYEIVADNSSLTLRGDFAPGSSVRLVVRKGMESVLGGRTQSDYDAEVLIGNVPPSFRYASPAGTYMLRSGGKTVEIRTVNLPRVIVRVSQVFANNLVHFLYGGRQYDWGSWSYSEMEGETFEAPRARWRYVLGHYGRVLRTDTVEVASPTNREVSTWIDLGAFLPDMLRGFYLLEIADPKEPWRTASKLVSVSDIGLIVKRSPGEVAVFAVSLDANTPMPGTRISLVSTTNQTMAAGATDAQGMARFADYGTLSREAALMLVTAESEEDFNFLNLADYRVETSRYDVEGKRDAAVGYDAMLYGDRPIYRPGETMIIAGVVREPGKQPPAGIPVRLKIHNPRGTLLSEQQLLLNEQGGFEARFPTSVTGQTGVHRVELFTGNDLYLAASPVSVEDFVPDRLRLTLKASAESARPGDRIRYELEAFNFFGPPAAGRTWEFEGSFLAVPFISKAYPSFRFSDDDAKNEVGQPFILKGETDGNGKARMEFPLPTRLASTGMLRARGRVAVFDESGRPVYQIAQTTVHPRTYYLGIQTGGSAYLRPNTPHTIRIVAVDPQDRPVDGFPAAVSLVRWEWHSVLRRHEGSGSFRYVSERREIPVRTEKIVLKGEPTPYTFTVPGSGEFSLRVGKQGDAGWNQFSFDAYSWGTTSVTSFQVDPEARVEIVPDRASYAPGDRARILFKAPFDGTMLVTVERSGVLSHRYLQVKDNASSMDLPVDDSFLPNVYVSAVLFRRLKEQSLPLLAGHGFTPIMVEKASNRLAVTIGAPDKIRPNTGQTVTVSAGEKDVFVTLAAVDEGICQLKNYATPDPYGFFYGRKALETETFDFFRDLLPEQIRGARESSSGGGDDEAVAKRANPLGVRRFAPVALWSGIVRTGASGAVEVPLAVPAFSGELRLMAFAYKGDRFGSAERAMKVADPVVLTPALPRFLSPGDSAVMPVTAFNTTARGAALDIGVEARGPLSAPVRSARLEVGPNQERFVAFPLKAGRDAGKAVVTVRTSAFGEGLESVTELPVRPAAPFAIDATAGVLEAGASVSHPVPDVYLPAGRSAYVTLSAFPVVNFAKRLSWLIGYPHGCIEQTTSRAFPQLYLRDIAAVLDPRITAKGSPGYFVNEAIAKIVSMQLPGGGFMYWPGGTSGGKAHPWATVYVTHFLQEARKAGYAVPDATLKPALEAVRTIARSKAVDEYRLQESPNRITVRRIADKSVLYAVYVLAAAGAPEKRVMEFYRTEKSLLAEDTRVLLAGSYALAGDRRTFIDLAGRVLAPEPAARTTDGVFDSPVRATALILNVLLDTDPGNPNVPRLMDYLSRIYRDEPWFSTQDDAFTLLAFGKAARLSAAGKAGATVTMGGKTQKYAGGTKRFELPSFGGTVTLTASGEGRLYYAVVTEGIRADGAVRVEDRNLRVRRELLDRNGTPVNPAAIRLNDLIVVRVTLTAGVERLGNIAVTDLLPAGFEIENPRLTDNTQYPFIRNASVPDYMDVRDDRMNIYTGFAPGDGGSRTFYYMARAVTQGSFRHAPVVAEAMYAAGQYYSASGGGVVNVVKP